MDEEEKEGLKMEEVVGQVKNGEREEQAKW